MDAKSIIALIILAVFTALYIKFIVYLIRRHEIESPRKNKVREFTGNDDEAFWDWYYNRKRPESFPCSDEVE